MDYAGPSQALGPSFTVFPGALAGFKVEHLEFEPEIWEAAIIGSSSLIHSATMLALQKHFNATNT